jgi:ribosomal protein S18 acetylase RimI-like enzyme
MTDWKEMEYERKCAMAAKDYDVTMVELVKSDAYLKEISSKYSMSHYYDVSIRNESGAWRVELMRKAFEKPLEKNYHGRLFENHIEEPRVFVAALNEQQVGWIELGYEKWNNRMRVWEFLVKEEYRGRGIGKSLMEQAVQSAREKGARMLVLETQTNNSGAISFYLGFGFELIGLDTAAYSNGDIEKKEVRLELGMRLQP